MNTTATFKVDYIDEKPGQKISNGRYKAVWRDKCYFAENLRVEIDSDAGSGEYISSYNTLDAVISEAEGCMLAAKFGIATIYDGKYRVAVVTKKYREEYTDANYTNYGKTCKRYEYTPKISGPFYDEIQEDC